MKKYICIDVGGTDIKYGIILENAAFAARGKTKTESYKGGKAVFSKVMEIARQLRTDNDTSGICISTAGMVDTQKGEIFYSSPLIPGYTGVNYKKAMEEEFRLPCEVENDVNCAGLAEYKSGAAMGYKIALMLTVGTGIGGCLIINGEVFHGFSNSACEAGNMHMDGSSFQELASASALTKKVAALKNGTEDEWNGYHIFEEAKKGDPVCCAAVDGMCDILGKGIANICYIANPGIVVLGGGIMEQEEFLQHRIRDALDRYLVESVAMHTNTAFAKHKNNAGMLGAFYNFTDKHGR